MQRILIREDFNVPIKDGVVQSDLRIRAALPGIKQALDSGAQVMLMSHLGRPEAGKLDAQYSLLPVAKTLEKLLNIPVKFVTDWYAPDILPTDKLVLFENVRFLLGETENSAELSKYMASLSDVFIMDAFGSAHRAHASTVGVAEYAPKAIAGPLLTQEITALDKIMRDPQRPLVAVIGGAKVSSKLDVLFSLIKIVDVLILGGGMANTLLAAQGVDVSDSLYEPDLISTSQKLFTLAQAQDCKILLPSDFVYEPGTKKIMDIGPETIKNYASAIQQAKTILWNGPMGVFEDSRFANGTREVALVIANSKAFSVAGGGDTLTAIDQYNLLGQISYVSTGGGAFLEYIEGKKLPAIQALLYR